MGMNIFAMVTRCVMLVALGVFASPADVAAQARGVPTRPAPAATSQPAHAAKQPINYEQAARANFDAGNYPKAIQYAAAQLKKDKSSRTSYVLMAQSYYRLGKIKRAAKLFSQIDPAEAPPDAAIEYLLSMYGTRRYKAAIRVFARIPDTHPYRDTASYYVGLSYMNLRLYSKAELYLRRARKIPANLKPERRRLISEIELYQDRERRGANSQGGAYYYDAAPPPPPSPMAPPPMVGPNEPKKGDKPDAKPAPTEGFTFTAVPEIDYTTANTRIDLFGFSQNDKNSNTQSAMMPMELKYRGASQANGQTTFSMGLNPSYTDNDGEVVTSSQVAQASNPNTVDNLTSTQSSHTYSDGYAAFVGGHVPVSENVEMLAAYWYTQTFQDANMIKVASLMGPLGGFIVDLDPIKVDATVGHFDTSDATKLPPAKRSLNLITAGITYNGEASVTKLQAGTGPLDSTGAMSDTKKGPSVTSLANEDTAIIADLSWKKPLGDFETTIALNYASKTPMADQILGSTYLSNEPEIAYKGSASETWTMNFGLALTLTGAYTQFDNFKTMLAQKTPSTGLADAPKIPIAASGTVKQVILKSSVALGSYLNASMSYDYSDRILNVSDPDYEHDFTKANWSQKTITKFGLELKYPF